MKSNKFAGIKFHYILYFICTVAAIISVVMIFKNINDYNIGKKSYNNISENAVTVISQEDNDDGEQITVPQVNFDWLKSQNPDIAAWIYGEGTVINYPVMVCPNNSYYLTHLFDKTENKNGSIFIENRNKPDFSDRLTRIYGHNMKNGTMFGSLLNYKNQEYFQAHRQLIIVNEDKNYKLEIFGAYAANVNDFVFTDDFNNYSADQMQNAINTIKSKSGINTSTQVAPTDNIVMLVTCVDAGESDYRFVVFCKLSIID